VLSAVLFLSAGNSFSMETENKQPAKSPTSADLFFNVRVNLKSASIIAGVWALRNLVYFSAYNFHHSRYWSTFEAIPGSIAAGIETALPIALLAVGFWGVDKFWLKKESDNALQAQTQKNNLSIE
jgi:hypothetical protein